MRKLFSSIVITILLAVIIFSGYFVYIITEKDQYSGMIEIKSNEPLVNSLSQLPISKNVAFKIYLKYFRNGGRNIKVGYYDINKSMNVIQLIDLFEMGIDKTYKVTVPEGYTVEQIVSLLENKNKIDKEKFYDILNKKIDEFPYNTPDGNFEGYFYPETYFISENADEEIIINTFLNEFLKRFPPDKYPDKDEFYEKLIMASILEREAMLDSEKPIMSSVFYNRIKLGMVLASDATVNFVFKYEKKRILYKDLRVDSPYNTYKNTGLPPAPISNPSVVSVEAAYNPADTDYLFFVAKGDGGHFFSKTYKEHINFQNNNKKSNKN
ncbi:MAG: endolytic transglycosylase MltG [Fusobacteriaceae bacterium]|nr:endolytic transglycosylase MltG [Fusobacteriaceae bacterium]